MARSVSGTITLLLPLVLIAGCAAASPTESSPPAPAQGAYDGPRLGADLPDAPRSDAEWWTYWNDLNNMADFYGVPDPQVERVERWIKPEEAPLYRDPCVREQGFTQEGRAWRVAEDQKSAFNRAMFSCFSLYPPIPRYIAPLTTENLEAVYEWIATVEIPCLEQRGFEIDGLPTSEVWIATYATDPYYPYEELPVLSSDELDELETECPQWPPSEVVYGS